MTSPLRCGGAFREHESDMNATRLRELLSQTQSARVGVFGDFCLDMYWLLDPALSEVSIETGKRTSGVRRQYASLGGAGGIVANLSDLGVAEVHAVGVLGNDLFGREVIRLLKARRADVSGMLIQEADWITPVYCKPFIGDEEQGRVDFGGANGLTPDTESALLKALAAMSARVDAVIINQQLPRGVNTDRVLEGINRLVAAHPERLFIVDSRDRSEAYHGVMYRMNAHEAMRMCATPKPREQRVLLEEARRCIERIAAAGGRPVFLSRGDRGSLVRAEGTTHEIPGIQILKEVDPVGAGDTSISAIAAALAAGAAPLEAAELANFASAVTVQKLKTTGTANPEEILATGSDPDYIFRPELADDPRAARCYEGSEIEVVSGPLGSEPIRFALFDHDGTLSTLRQGWEPIMEEVFIRSILGARYDSCDESVYGRVANRVREFINRSTGIQTINQMVMLAEMVVEAGYVPKEQVLSPAEYKRNYLAALMGTVRRRVEKLQRGELDPVDFTIKGAAEFLKSLRSRGVTLYLASGTDHEDVVREANGLGYADLFNGGIFGSIGRVDRDAKREVIGKILSNPQLSGAALACFGDGPVELRESKKRNGRAVGVASDEVRRYGMNPEKRSRLIRAGADLIIPDFSQLELLLQFLRVRA